MDCDHIVDVHAEIVPNSTSGKYIPSQKSQERNP